MLSQPVATSTESPAWMVSPEAFRDCCKPSAVIGGARIHRQFQDQGLGEQPAGPQPVGTTNGQRPIERYIGFDLHKQDSQLCTLSLNGELLREIRIRTTASSLRGSAEVT